MCTPPSPSRKRPQGGKPPSSDAREGVSRPPSVPIGEYLLDPLGRKRKKDKDKESPPSTTKPETTATTGRSKELAIQTAKAKERKRLALRGRRRTILTGGQGVLGFPTIGRKKLLGE